MDPVADILNNMSIGRSWCFSKDLDSRPLAHADWVKEIRGGTSLFCVDFHKAKVIPYAINEIVQAAWNQQTVQHRSIYYGSLKVHLAANDNCVVITGQTVHRLETDGVDFVIDIWRSCK
jgi:hypothetical protein